MASTSTPARAQTGSPTNSSATAVLESLRAGGDQYQRERSRDPRVFETEHVNLPVSVIVMEQVERRQAILHDQPLLPEPIPRDAVPPRRLSWTMPARTAMTITFSQEQLNFCLDPSSKENERSEG